MLRAKLTLGAVMALPVRPDFDLRILATVAFAMSPPPPQQPSPQSRTVTDRVSDERPSQCVIRAVRLDREVYDWLRHYGEGYSTRMNSILLAVMSRAR